MISSQFDNFCLSCHFAHRVQRSEQFAHDLSGTTLLKQELRKQSNAQVYLLTVIFIVFSDRPIHLLIHVRPYNSILNWHLLIRFLNSALGCRLSVPSTCFFGKIFRPSHPTFIRIPPLIKFLIFLEKYCKKVVTLIELPI